MITLWVLVANNGTVCGVWDEMPFIEDQILAYTDTMSEQCDSDIIKINTTLSTHKLNNYTA